MTSTSHHLFLALQQIPFGLMAQTDAVVHSYGMPETASVCVNPLVLENLPNKRAMFFVVDWAADLVV
jgi:hypothetical protein